MVKLWEYIEQIRKGQLRELAPLLVVLVDNPDVQTLREERTLILAEPDQAQRADLLALAVTIAARNFDREFLRRFFREELVQMQHATLIDEWLEEAVEKAVEKAEAEAIVRGMHERAIASILRILTIRFDISTVQQAAIKIKLDQFTELTQLDDAEEHALRAFTFAEFNGYVESLPPPPHANGSAQ